MVSDIQKKLLSIEETAEAIEKLKQSGKQVVFTNGCFDLIHTGHTRYLNAARNVGDCLVVGVNSDVSVKALKGDKRPIVSLEDRMEVLASLFFVDYVVSFDELDPYQLIKVLKPTVLVKGGDWPLDKIIGRDLVEASGGQVLTIPVIEGRSTTGIVERITRMYQQVD